ncbi:MAG: hypothetical protein WBO95_19290 [Candidatus Dechloromonas phosphoritropha]
MRRCLDQGDPPDEALLARAIEVFKLHYAAVNGEKTRIFEGVFAGLDAWRATGLPLAVLTNKPAAFTEPLLERMGLKHLSPSSSPATARLSASCTPNRCVKPARGWAAP